MSEALAPIIQGAESDLQTYALNIVGIAIDAGAAGDQDTLDQVNDQALALLEANRLRIAANADAIFAAVVPVILNFALKFAANVLIPGGGALIPPISIPMA